MTIDKNGRLTLSWIDLPSGANKEIYSGANVSNLVFGKDANQLALYCRRYSAKTFCENALD